MPQLIELQNGDVIINDYFSKIKRQAQLAKEIKMQSFSDGNDKNEKKRPTRT